MEYEFTLTYQLAPTDSDHEAIVERLGAAGCTDALVGTGHPGRVAIEFIREARSAQDAMNSALRDVHAAIPTAKLIEVSPDLVGISDVAAITGVTRQNLRKLLERHAAGAPTPVHAGTPSLWHLTDMLAWLREQVNYQYPPMTLEVARAAEQINLRKESARQGHHGLMYV